jgi:hypothetical protein
MRACRVVEFMSRFLPARAWKGNLLERHVGRCPSCQARLALRDEARAYVIGSAPDGSSGSFWPAVEAGIRETAPSMESRPRTILRLWKPSVALLAMAGALVLIRLASRQPKPVGTASPGTSIEGFRLDSVEIQGRPAQALVFQPRDSRITFIWVR